MPSPTRGNMQCLGTWPLHQFIHQSNISKSPPGHNSIIPTSTSVRIKLSWHKPKYKTITK